MSDTARLTRLALARKLDESSFPGKAPRWYEGFEWGFRIGSFMYPALLPIDASSSSFTPGLILYSAGLALYCASWIPFLMHPVPSWARTPIIEFAPAYLPILWLCGISMMTGSWAHGGVSALFITLHVGEKAMIYRKS